MRGASRSPNRRESSSAIGRAPIVKMSRRMPPTPVAAPWYGSMNDGWLWLSILKTAASPSPMSTAPAFSPGPWITCGPVVGSWRSQARELLYEQCSDHITPKTPSSSNVGARPRTSTTLAYSSAVRPWSAATSAVTADTLTGPGLDRPEDREAVLATRETLGGVFRVRHEAEHVPLCAAHPGDVAERAVGVRFRLYPPGRVGVAEH